MVHTNGDGLQSGEQTATPMGHGNTTVTTGDDVAHAMLTGWPEWRAIPGHDTTPWGGLSWETCIDGKQRAIMPGIRLLADGFPERVACLHGFGNAIVPQVAAEFIKAYQDIIGDIYVEVK